VINSTFNNIKDTTIDIPPIAIGIQNRNNVFNIVFAFQMLRIPAGIDLLWVKMLAGTLISMSMWPNVPNVVQNICMVYFSKVELIENKFRKGLQLKNKDSVGYFFSSLLLFVTISQYSNSLIHIQNTLSAIS